MTISGFISLLAVCVTIVGVAAVITYGVYRVKKLAIDASRSERLDKLGHEITLKQMQEQKEERDRQRYLEQTTKR